jgi:hypothetical protein
VFFSKGIRLAVEEETGMFHRSAAGAMGRMNRLRIMNILNNCRGKIFYHLRVNVLPTAGLVTAMVLAMAWVNS